ncbi:MAG: hypothetical protein PUB05_01165 [Firmicutes bacterium]|nr:hypothetical protein [Bacillota bacterium]
MTDKYLQYVKSKYLDGHSDGPYFDTDVWVPVPLIGKKQRDEGYTGGEGCQWCEQIVFDPVDGHYALFGNDCAGMYRSGDEGKTWENATLGFIGRSASNFTIDPNNTSRVYCTSGRSARESTGIHVSDDEGRSWEPLFMNPHEHDHVYYKRLAIDETSFDAELGVSSTVYWLSLCINGKEDEPHGLFKTTDGGASWHLLDGTTDFAGNEMVCAANGYLYIRTADAIYRSKDGGSTFDKIYEGEMGSICVIRTRPESVYAMVRKVGLIVSHDCGDHFEVMTEGEFDYEFPNHLAVSPADPDYMVMEDDHYVAGDSNNLWRMVQYYSHDGGRTWHESERDRKTGFFVPYNPRQTITSFHPLDKNIALSLGGDAIMRSTDGGKTFVNSSDGYNGLCIGATASFNAHNGNLVAIPAQDYNGGFSVDGGYTFTYVKWLDRPWGGHAYGSYCLDEQTVISISSNTWRKVGEMFVAATFDGGETVNIFSDCKVNSDRCFCCGSARNSDIAFCGNWRTTDRARSWTEMTDCDAVFSADPVDGTLVGVHGTTDVVISRDDGASWQVVAQYKGGIRDAAYNRDTNRLFVALDDHLFEVDIETGDMVERDTGTITLVSVAIDPVNSKVMYVCGNNDFDFNFNSVMRSVDGGLTWSTLKRQPGDGRTGPDGARKPGLIRVNPTTRELWAFTWCYGVWKIAPPQGF